MWSVYSLIDPRDNTIRYVGITTDTATRLDQHLDDAKKKSEKGKWLTELKQAGLSPVLRVLEPINATGDTRAIARDRERYWIQTLLQSGAHLVNDFGVIRAYPQYGRPQPIQSPERPRRLRTGTINQRLKQRRLDASPYPEQNWQDEQVLTLELSRGLRKVSQCKRLMPRRLHM